MYIYLIPIKGGNILICKYKYIMSKQTRKQDKGKPIFGLEKLPASILLKASRQECGELKSYIDELEDKVALLELQISEKNAIIKQLTHN